ncbi:MAG: MFS transporter [Myxococcales bacterium]|nr:MFS transporter [Myxococcales bacterium]
MLGGLLITRRFWPLFWTQFLGAFNDNFFKNALVILITFRAVHIAGIPPEQMVALSTAVFILPYFLFSGFAGLLADKLDKAAVVRGTKLAEIGVMALGAAGFVLESPELLVLVLFFMGLQSTVFGPCKYAILPQHLQEEELVSGNALVEMATYLAILLGTIVGGILVGMPGGDWLVAVGVVLTAVVGFGAATFIPPAPSVRPDLRMPWDPVRPTLELLRVARRQRPVWLAILGISWFWSFGAVLLSLFPAYTKDVLGGGESLATLFLAMFSVGIGMGSVLCERLSRERVELGLVPLGALGMSVFCLDLWLVGQPWAAPEARMAVSEFLSTWSGLRITVDLGMLAMFGGFMIVPLYSFIQLRALPHERSRVIAGNNVVNAVWMVASSLALTGVFALDVQLVDVFLGLAVLNLAVTITMYTVVAEFMLRFVVWVLSFGVYRLKVEGEEHIPREGPCVLVANHVSFIDWFVIAAAVRRPPRFVMYHRFMKLPLISYLFRQAQVIPIAGAKEDPELLQQAMDRISSELQDGWTVCIFPEGTITETGEMMPFRPGIERIVQRDPVPVVPMAINGLWGSFFSRKDGSAMTRPFRRVWSRVSVTVGAPVPASEVTAAGLQDRVAALLARHPDP